MSLQRVKVLLFQGINSDRPEQRLVLLDSRISLVISFSLFYLFLTDWLVTDISRHLFTKYSPLMRYLLHSLQLQVSDKPGLSFGHFNENSRRKNQKLKDFLKTLKILENLSNLCTNFHSKGTF